jgi:hypothetical protein
MNTRCPKRISAAVAVVRDLARMTHEHDAGGRAWCPGELAWAIDQIDLASPHRAPVAACFTGLDPAADGSEAFHARLVVPLAAEAHDDCTRIDGDYRADSISVSGDRVVVPEAADRLRWGPVMASPLGSSEFGRRAFVIRSGRTVLRGRHRSNETIRTASLGNDCHDAHHAHGRSFHRIETRASRRRSARHPNGGHHAVSSRAPRHAPFSL